MPSPEYKKLREEVRLKEKDGLMSKGQRIVLEQQLLKDLPQKCVKCGRPTDLTLDHIVPIQVLISFGVDTEREIIEDNYQILCRRCNVFKANRLDFTIPQTKVILLRLLDKI